MNEIPYERVKIARDNGRPTGTDYIKNIFKNFIEFHGDRCYADDKAIVGGIARLTGMPVTVIAIEKGHTAKERSYRNFGAPHPEGYRKALRLMKQAEKLLWEFSSYSPLHKLSKTISSDRTFSASCSIYTRF